MGVHEAHVTRRSRLTTRGLTPWLTLVAVVLGVGLSGAAHAQPVGATLRLALLPQWVVNQHRSAASLGARGAVSPQLARTLDGGVVDRVVFWWQRGVIHRDSLVWKPIRVLDGDEAAALGGRGSFDLAQVRAPAGGTAWTEVQIAPRAGQAAEVAVIQIGGELAPLRQVLDSLHVTAPDGSLSEVELARRALVRGAGVQVITAPFDRPVTAPDARSLFEATGGLELLVVRSQVEVSPGAGATPNGFGDLSAFGAGAWREGDRVLVRVRMPGPGSGLAPMVLGWRDRLFRPDGGDVNELRRSSRLAPAPR
jgi:hypothetical protein